MLRSRASWLLLLFVAGLTPLVPQAHAEDLESYLVGELTSLEILESPVSLAEHQITYPDGSEHALGEKDGKALLVNVWARGCVPCRDEMPHLSNLQRDLGDDRFEVVALPWKQRSIKSARKILNAWKAENLTPYSHDIGAMARILYEQGLFPEREISFVFPTTYLVNKKGQILAVREGFLHWDSPESRKLIAAMKEDRIP